MTWKDRWVVLGEATETASFDRHYVLHTAWASRILAETRPSAHVDVASSLYFVANVSALIPIHFIDYRPAQLGLRGVTSDKGDLLHLKFPDRSVRSISCMHVVEHVGLGRYGDPLDYDGDLKAAAELKRVLAPGGLLLIVVPVGGRARIQFNAHRIYAYRQVIEMFDGLALREFALIRDDGAEEGLIRDASEELADAQRYGCGCFLFERITGR